MKINLKRLKNHSKTFIALICTGILFFASCKKTDSNTNSLNWDVKKQEISNKVKTDLANLKAILPYTISRANNGDISFNNQKITEYYNIHSTSITKTFTYSKPKTSDEIIANIKAKQLSSLNPNEGGPSNPIDEDDPYEVYTRDGYRNNYRLATENFIDLPSYLATMNAISEDIISSSLLTTDEKVMMFTEIETLKQFAIDLETNPNYWIDLYAPSEASSGSSFVKNNSIMSIGGSTNTKNIFMVTPRQGCKIDTRAALLNGVVGGFIAAVGYAKVGAIAGTVSVPGVGTVTGAVSGFMAGFALGFVTGVGKAVVLDLLKTCGR